MVKPHESFFEYPVSRPYPYRWFTPVVIFGVIILLVVFSIINVASTGYNLEIQYTSNPNDTTSKSYFANWPALASDKIRPRCQAAVAAVDSRLVSNNSALSYTVTDVTRSSAGTETLSLPSLLYNNNVLQNCTLLSITIQLDGAQSGGRTAAQIAWSTWGAQLQGRLSCTVANGNDGLTTVNLTAQYNLVPPTISIHTGANRFVGRNATSQASLWWGESMLQNYWYQLTNKTAEENEANWIDKGKNGLTNGYLFITFNDVHRSVSIKDLDYFSCLYRFIIVSDTNRDSFIHGNRTDTFKSLIAKKNVPNIWHEADSLAKAFYSTILTDLGQADSQPNILIDQDLLRHFTADFKTLTERDFKQPGPSQTPYDPANSHSGPLGVQPAVLAMDYICQVPVLKSWANLLISLIVADLVFVQAIWFIFRSSVRYFVKRRVPEANVCEGCMQRDVAADDAGSQVPLRELDRVPDGLNEQETAYGPAGSDAPPGTKASRFRMNVRRIGWQRLDS